MPITDKCPFCGSSTVLAGNVRSAHGFGFTPEEIKKGFLFTFRSLMAFKFGPSAHFCAKCFMVWSKADPKDAVKFLGDYANDDLKARLATQIVPEPPAGI
jgi:hypothetical protein